MSAENIDLKFAPEAITEISKIAAEVNETVENIGARCVVMEWWAMAKVFIL